MNEIANFNPKLGWKKALWRIFLEEKRTEYIVWVWVERVGPNCKTSRKFIGITKKSMVKNHHQNIFEIWSKKMGRERQIARNEISLEDQIFHWRSLLTRG